MRTFWSMVLGPTDEEFWWWSAKRWCDSRVDLWHQLTGKNFCTKMIWSIVITLGGNLLDISKNSGGDLHKDDMYDPHVYLSSWQVRFLRKEDKFQCIAINLGGNLLALSNFCTIPASLSTFTLKHLQIFGEGIFSDGVDSQSYFGTLFWYIRSKIQKTK